MWGLRSPASTLQLCMRLTLDPDTLVGRLSQLGIRLSLDLYRPAAEPLRPCICLNWDLYRLAEGPLHSGTRQTPRPDRPPADLLHADILLTLDPDTPFEVPSHSYIHQI